MIQMRHVVFPEEISGMVWRLSSAVASRSVPLPGSYPVRSLPGHPDKEEKQL